MKTKQLFKTVTNVFACALVVIFSKSNAQTNTWSTTTDPITTDSKVQIAPNVNNTTNITNLTIGPSSLPSTSTSTSTKLLIQEDNPWIELKDNSGWACCGGAPYGANIGIRFTTPSTTGYELSYNISSAGPTLSLKQSSNGFGVHITGTNMYLGTIGTGLTISNGGGLTVSGASTFNSTVIIGNAPIRTGYKLFVQQGILTEKLKIALTTSTAWSDFVFDESYKLPSLNYVESYVKENKHLPEIPSAKEVYANGLDVAEMDAKLLQKIEELTLYLIEMKKENELLKNKLEMLEEKISE